MKTQHNGDINLKKDLFLREFRHSLKVIKVKRFFSTERCYQGRLLSELDKRIKIKKILLGEIVIEQEYQKKLKNHGIKIRPDIIIHVPYRKKTHPSPRSGNFVVIQLKLDATEEKAKKDFMEQDIGLIYEYIEKAGPRSINGHPSFFSCQTLNKEDTTKMFKHYEKLNKQEKVNETMGVD